MFLFFFTGCKKDNFKTNEPEPNPITLADSIYFEVDGRAYKSNHSNLVGVGNKGANMKLSDIPLAGQKAWGTIGLQSYYSSVDSIYFSYQRGFDVSDDSGDITITFGKASHVRDLNAVGRVWYLKDIRDILDTGKQEFAVDYESANSINGVSFVIYKFGTTCMPEHTFDDSSDPNLQNDAHFKITKKEQIDKDRYRIYAEFEMNIYDRGRNKRRVTKGFLRLTVDRVFTYADLFRGKNIFDKN
ncbi:hypothetical protein PBAL39_21335 [Pedobacter sp. BAL39]|nr:hypothetical protein PBAL39_21335 [Pedobacter sp. BAL39]